MDTKDTLLAYSEWLDADQHLVVSDQGEGADTRTHDELVLEFIAEWANDKNPIIRRRAGSAA